VPYRAVDTAVVVDAVDATDSSNKLLSHNSIGNLLKIPCSAHILSSSNETSSREKSLA
jgi:hypothetical protein